MQLAWRCSGAASGYQQGSIRFTRTASPRTAHLVPLRCLPVGRQSDDRWRLFLPSASNCHRIMAMVMVNSAAGQTTFQFALELNVHTVLNSQLVFAFAFYTSYDKFIFKC